MQIQTVCLNLLLKPILGIGVAILLSACVSNVSSQIKAEDKDTSGKFDGKWLANVQKMAGRQVLPGNWVANCQSTPDDFTVSVINGRIAFNPGGALHQTYISNEGEFRFDIPLQGKAEANAGSSGTIGLAERTLILYGNMAKEEGRITFGVQEFGNNGCTTTIKFSKA